MIRTIWIGAMTSIASSAVVFEGLFTDISRFHGAYLLLGLSWCLWCSSWSNKALPRPPQSMFLQDVSGLSLSLWWDAFKSKYSFPYKGIVQGSVSGCSVVGISVPSLRMGIMVERLWSWRWLWLMKRKGTRTALLLIGGFKSMVFFMVSTKFLA
ncbi:hypothetical protein FB192DRAFT_1076429 [Mucor lusitanicus]|uniref:Uncharacterized protein n=1 Tax=Mucor circinelloides f. lusitanicus TaxID=29924 RepID=A0A8H4BJR7_MUCCL|nr:hypothetical protein FB192DRAFT_1076429 [Mucor lusitanicus]